MTFFEWLQVGIDNGWCGPGVCATHDGIPMSAEEANDDGPCLAIVRLYNGPEHKAAIETEHGPSTWRNNHQ